MILCEWDASEGHPGMLCTPVCCRILSTSFSSVSIFFVCCYSNVSISVILVICTLEKSKVTRELEQTVFCLAPE
jgi:hypothetical protein